MNSTDTIIFPPGKKLNLDITITHCGSITLGSTYSQPLPTLVDAVRSEDNTRIKVTAIVFINTKETENEDVILPVLIVNQLFTISNYGEPQLQFFIHCNKEELLKIGKNQIGMYQAFQVIFTTKDMTGFPDGIEMKEVVSVQTFLWDIDPKTSRGTVTTVQPTVPN